MGGGASGGPRTAGGEEAKREVQGQGKSINRGRGTGELATGLRLRLRLRLAGWLLYSIFIGRQAGLEPGSVAREARAGTTTP